MKLKISYRSMRATLLVLLLLGNASLFAQSITVTGTVKDATGESLIGVSVLEISTQNGTITDYDGNFTLQVAPDAKLQISYIGYQTQEVSVAGKTHLSITLSEDVQALEDVVIIGYGVVKKEDATGSVTAIKPDNMNKGLNTNMQEMLQGKIAGVNITTDGGTPGGGATIRIRGGSSLNASNDPLIVIDGLAMDNDGIQGVSNPLSMVNPNDIETITVLKDASATAIYGSRASNGVIIITTKKGTAGSKPKVSYSGNISTSILTDRLEVLSGDDLRTYANALYSQDLLSDDAMSTLGTENTDWQDAIYRTAISTDHNISVAGGTKNMPYRVSVGYTLQNGIIKTSQMQRYTAAVNLSPTFFDKHLSFNVNAKGMYITNQFADGGVVGAALSMDPTKPIYDKSTNLFGGYYQGTRPANYNDNKWTLTPNQQTTANPLATLEQKDDRSKAGSFVGNIEADYKIHGFEDLRLHANFGADYSYGIQNTVISPYSYSNHYYGWDGYTEKQKYNLSFNAYAQYYKDFTQNQHFDVMLGYEWQHFYNDGISNGQGTYPNTNNDESLRGTAYNPYSDEWATESYLVSFFGRLNYIAMNRYMITATLRGDGSSRFAPENRWGLFPSVALGWKLKEEAFLQDVNWLSDLKLRLGYGITGQQNLLQGDYPYMPVYVVSKEHAYYTLGEKDANGEYIYYTSYRPNEYNPELTWEKTTTYNAGIDFGFMNARITGSIDYYYRLTTDLINVVDVPAQSNFKNRVISNVGSLTNQGVEFMLNAVAIDTKKLRWDLGFNATWNQNEITKLTTGDGDGYFIATGGIGNNKTVQAHAVGHPANSFYVYETYIDENGKYQIIDQTGDGEITAEDKIFYHSPAPDCTLGLTSKWQFFNFDLGFSLRASIGNYVYNNVLSDNLQWVPYNMVYQNQNGGFHSLQQNAYNMYYGVGEFSTPFHREDYSEGQLVDLFVENASFLRCDNITLGYTFDKPNIKARVYVTAQNPFVITGYSGLDPEVSGGIDSNIYPRSLTGIVGFSLEF